MVILITRVSSSYCPLSKFELAKIVSSTATGNLRLAKTRIV